MKVCRHFKLFKDEELVEEFERAEYPWNVWRHAYKNGKEIYNSFESGLYWKYLIHLLQSPECREEIGISLEGVLQLLQEIEKERKQVVQ